MFKRTGYFNPTGFRRAISSYAPVTPQQAANRFTLKYVPSYVPPPPPPPAPVIDNGGGDNDSFSGIGNDYWNDQYQGDGGGYNTDINSGPGDFDSGVNYSYEDDYSDYSNNDNNNSDNGQDPTGMDGGYGDMGVDDGGSFGGGWWNIGGTIPPLYADRGDFIDAMPGIPEKGVPSNIGTTTQQSTEAFSNVKDATSKGTIASAFDSAKSKAKDAIDTAIENPLDTAIDFGVGKAITSALMEFGMKSNPATALAFGLQRVGQAFYDNKTAYDQAEDPAVPDMPGYSSETPPDGPVTNPADFNFKDYNYGIISSEVEKEINDIAAEIDTPTTSSPPSTISDHANVHGPDPSPPSSQPPGIGPGPATPSYGGGMSSSPSYGSGSQDDGDFGGHPGMGGGSNSPGNNGGHTGGGAMDGSEAQSDGYGGLGHSKGGHIYASQGGYVNSTGGK